MPTSSIPLGVQPVDYGRQTPDGRDHGPNNIRVDAICPGYVDTPMLKRFFDAKGDAEAASMRAEARLVHPLRRYGTPEDMAKLVNWLAGDEARYATGHRRAPLSCRSEGSG